LLRPDDETNNAFVYCVAEAAQRFGLDVILVQMMSNHYHGGLYDPHARDPELREHLNKMLAKCLNARRGRWENLWSTEETCVVEMITAEALLDKLVYIATNPVLDNLVEEVHQWPGPNFVKALLKGLTMKATRPRYFFSKDGCMPPEVELVLKLPDHFPNKEAFLEELGRRITAVEEACRLERRKKGRTVLGRRRVKRQSWRDSPTSHEPRRGIRPRVATRSKWARIAALQRNKEWQADYRVAFERHRAGLPAVFPYGTYRMKRIANVDVAPGPRPPIRS
jgi:REP-associated tyrosine transposase